MRIKLSLIFALSLACHQIDDASAAFCSKPVFTGSVSTSCYESFNDDNESCNERFSGNVLCTRIEISAHTLDSMIDASQAGSRLRGVLNTIKEKMTRKDPRSGVVLTYKDEIDGPKPVCSVYLRNGIFIRLGPIIHQFTNDFQCFNVGIQILVDFMDQLRNRIGPTAQPYDKVFFATYPVDQIRSHYLRARVDPAHSIFTSLADEASHLENIPSLSVKSMPVSFYESSGFKSIGELASALEFSDEENAWQAIWSFNYDVVHDPMGIPQDVMLAVPLVAHSPDDWQGPFDAKTSAENLAIDVYKNEAAVDMVERVKEITDLFGEEEIYLPTIYEEGFKAKEVFFFD